MTEKEFNAFCGSLPATTYVVQWGGAHVWKVGGKVFAIGTWGDGKYSGITFKVSDFGWEVLHGKPGVRPAPYLASRGMKWMQQFAKPGLSKRELKHFLTEAHRVVSHGLSKKLQRELNLNQG